MDIDSISKSDVASWLHSKIANDDLLNNRIPGFSIILGSINPAGREVHALGDTIKTIIPLPKEEATDYSNFEQFLDSRSRYTDFLDAVGQRIIEDCIPKATPTSVGDALEVQAGVETLIRQGYTPSAIILSPVHFRTMSCHGVIPSHIQYFSSGAVSDKAVFVHNQQDSVYLIHNCSDVIEQDATRMRITLAVIIARKGTRQPRTTSITW